MYPIRDPQLVTALNNFDQLLPNGIDLDDIPAMRVIFDELFTAMAEQAPPIDGTSKVITLLVVQEINLMFW